MDEDILNTVHSMFGKSVNIVDCQTTSSVVQEEVLLINGVEIKLNGKTNSEAVAIKTALLEGQIPSVESLNQLLYQAGLSQTPIELETALSVKTSLKTTEDVIVSKHGHILNERSSETKEDYLYKSEEAKILQPLLHKDVSKLTHNTKFSTKSVNAAMPSNLIRNATDNLTDNCSSRESSSAATTRSNTQEIYPSNSTCSTFGASSAIDKSRSDLYSNISNCSTYTYSNPTATSSSSAISDTTLSYDSGHDGIFHSISQSAPINDEHKFKHGNYNNSLSSCFDIASSSDEIHIMRKNSQNETCDSNNTIGKIGYKYPQTSADIITNEPLNEKLALTYNNNKLISAPLDALILHLVPTNNYYPDDEFAFTFMLTARLFLPTHELLAKIKHFWERQNAELSNQHSDEVDFIRKNPTITARAKSASNMLHLLQKWIETFPYDFRNEQLMQEVRQLTKKCIEINPNETKNMSTILQKLVETLTKLIKLEEARLKYQQQQEETTLDTKTAATNNHHSESHLQQQQQQQTTTSNNKLDKYLKDLSSNPKELAHQLTIIELELLSQIGLQEFLDVIDKDSASVGTTSTSNTTSAGAKTAKSTQQTNNKSLRLSQCLQTKMTGNLEAYVQWFNRLCCLTANEILKLQKKKHRVQMIEYWIETARECFNIGNFNSLMAILAGLNMVPITRLKKTWSKVQSEKFSVLEHQMDPTSNFNSYRSTMKAAVWRSERARSAERERIVIPFFTLFLKDLYFLNESCASRLPNNHINFEKCSHLAKQLRDYAHWTKQTNCPYTKLPAILDYLQQTTVLNEEALQRASFACEPPDNADEKIHYKTLKNESKN